jgi:predicted phosphodiesterase
MRIGILSDVHGNLPALEACLAEAHARGCREFISLGDVFGYLPDGRSCDERLRDVRATMLLGNHEAMLLGLLPVTAEGDEIHHVTATRESLSADHLHRISTQVPFLVSHWGDRTFLLVHGTPQDPLQGYAYPDGDFGYMAALPYDYVVMGNTHRSLMRSEGAVKVINVGSVGLPRDVGNVGTFGVFDSDLDAFEIVQVVLDTEALVARYSAAHPLVHDTWRRR